MFPAHGYGLIKGDNMDPITIALGLAKIVPLAAKWLGGDKTAEAAQEVLTIAETVTGKKGNKAEDAIASDPNLAIAFKNRLIESEEKLDRLFLQDKKDARQRDIELRKLGYRNARADLMIIVAVVALVVNIYLLATNPTLPQSIIAIFNMMVGSLLTMLNSAYQFEFGSSRGSKEKDIK